MMRKFLLYVANSYNQKLEQLSDILSFERILFVDVERYQTKSERLKLQQTNNISPLVLNEYKMLSLIEYFVRHNARIADIKFNGFEADDLSNLEVDYDINIGHLVSKNDVRTFVANIDKFLYDFDTTIDEIKVSYDSRLIRILNTGEIIIDQHSVNKLITDKELNRALLGTGGDHFNDKCCNGFC